MKNTSGGQKNVSDALLKTFGNRIDRKSAEQAAAGNTDALFCSLSEEEQKKVTGIMNDPEKMKQLLSSKQAQELLRRLSGNGHG